MATYIVLNLTAERNKQLLGQKFNCLYYKIAKIVLVELEINPISELNSDHGIFPVDFLTFLNLFWKLNELGSMNAVCSLPLIY